MIEAETIALAVPVTERSHDGTDERLLGQDTAREDARRQDELPTEIDTK